MRLSSVGPPGAASTEQAACLLPAAPTHRAACAGDDGPVTIGANSNLQDGVTVLPGNGQVGGHPLPTTIGQDVTIGHGATLLGATLEDETLVGMGATLLSGVKVCTRQGQPC